MQVPGEQEQAVFLQTEAQGGETDPVGFFPKAKLCPSFLKLLQPLSHAHPLLLKASCSQLGLSL